jgi:hypothetical protein
VIRIAIAAILAAILAGPAQAAPACKRVHKLTTPCTGRLIPDTLYLELWRTKTVTVPRLEARLRATEELRAADADACARRLASCEAEVREIEVIVEKRVEVAAPMPIGEIVLASGVALVVGIAVGIVVGKFAL